MTGERGRCPVHGIALERATGYDVGAVCPRCATDDAPELAADGGVTDADPLGADLEAILDVIREDPELRPVEKETSIYFSKPDAVAHVDTLERGLTRRFLQHPHFEVDRYKLRAPDGALVTRGPRALREHGLTGDVVGIAGEIPIGTLSIGLTSRASTSHADIVTERVLGEEGRQ